MGQGLKCEYKNMFKSACPRIKSGRRMLGSDLASMHFRDFAGIKNVCHQHVSPPGQFQNNLFFAIDDIRMPVHFITAILYSELFELILSIEVKDEEFIDFNRDITVFRGLC